MINSKISKYLLWMVFVPTVIIALRYVADRYAENDSVWQNYFLVWVGFSIAGFLLVKINQTNSNSKNPKK
ncbi:hypothetical protein [Halalkalibacillus halophilus]|uniref:hypothetical protein n=1 Tax=Halalkalibacillus halophilus TaxID=392827 RepID=UPI00041616EB|nr:hypothetical protein [Halalkalibacillus halophilus]